MTFFKGTLTITFPTPAIGSSTLSIMGTSAAQQIPVHTRVDRATSFSLETKPVAVYSISLGHVRSAVDSLEKDGGKVDDICEGSAS